MCKPAIKPSSFVHKLANRQQEQSLWRIHCLVVAPFIKDTAIITMTSSLRSSRRMGDSGHKINKLPWWWAFRNDPRYDQEYKTFARVQQALRALEHNDDPPGPHCLNPYWHSRSTSVSCATSYLHHQDEACSAFCSCSDCMTQRRFDQIPKQKKGQFTRRPSSTPAKHNQRSHVWFSLTRSPCQSKAEWHEDVIAAHHHQREDSNKQHNKNICCLNSPPHFDRFKETTQYYPDQRQHQCQLWYQEDPYHNREYPNTVCNPCLRWNSSNTDDHNTTHHQHCPNDGLLNHQHQHTQKGQPNHSEYHSHTAHPYKNQPTPLNTTANLHIHRQHRNNLSVLSSHRIYPAPPRHPHAHYRHHSPRPHHHHPYNQDALTHLPFPDPHKSHPKHSPSSPEPRTRNHSYTRRRTPS